jgi:hypothetical protein
MMDGSYSGVASEKRTKLISKRGMKIISIF